MIGIFASGLGSLAVLREIQRRLPAGDFLFFGDTAGGPYDDKSPGLAASRLTEGLVRLADEGAALLVVADHGAAACLTAEVRNHLSLPTLDILTHGVVPAVAALTPGSLGIMGPSIVEAAGAHERAIGEALPDARIYVAAVPLLSSLVDAGWVKKPETVMIVKKYLHYFKLRQVDALVAASCHYLQLTSLIQRKVGKRVALVDGTPELARRVKTLLEEQPELEARCTGGGTCRAAVSDLTDAMTKTARMFYGKNIRLERG